MNGYNVRVLVKQNDGTWKTKGSHVCSITATSTRSAEEVTRFPKEERPLGKPGGASPQPHSPITRSPHLQLHQLEVAAVRHQGVPESLIQR
jgi:hypothetical protein